MFFNLAQTPKINFSFHYELPNGLVLSTDDGWEEFNYKNYHVVFKGYANKYASNNLITYLVDEKIPLHKGNFCAFITDGSKTKILHDTNRAFSIWTDQKNLTNLDSLEEQIWADCLLTVDNNFEISRDWFEPYAKDESNKSDEQILDHIHQTILETYEQFLTHNTKPLKIFLSGGLDTTTSWAYLDHFTKNYETVDYEYMKYTDFLKKNTSTIKRMHWAYSQMHLWDEDCVFVTGGNGDENFLRGPTTLAMALKKHGIVFKDILHPDDYHYYYLTKKDNDDTIQKMFKETKDVDDWILNRNINDHQHWHLDRTITFTPFKDISILASVLSASKELLIAQAKNGDINRRLISKLDPNKLNKISTQKNLNAMEAV